MKRRFTRFIAAALLVTSFAVARADGPTLTDDGLEPLKLKNIDKAYRRPDAKLGSYDKIILKPIDVSFSKGWNPLDYGDKGLRAKDVEKLRGDLAKLAEQTFAKVLNEGGYATAPASDTGVLEVEVRIVDLFLNAPDVDHTANVKVYALSAGEMELVVTLRDSVSGTTLFRSIDHKRDPDAVRLEWANRVWNHVQLRHMLEGWAEQLKNALNSARG
ncbi:MAG TPA: DUF3313 family protein [Steroidobacteraceae bacterium]|nr:DUF3313 family protein [Steroidobacteraceae bacterium]